MKNPRTGENFLVTAIAGNTLTSVRAIDGDGVTGVAMNDNDDLIIIGNAQPEGADLPAVKSHAETYPYNYTQIFRNSFGVTRSQDASDNYTGKDRPRLRMEKAVEHKIDMERAFILGERNLVTTGPGSTNAPIRLMGGFLYFATSNVKNAGGTLTEAEVETWLETVFEHTSGKDSRILFASAKVISTIDMLAAGRLQTVPKEDTYGVRIKEWVTSHGSLMIVKHRLLKDGTSSTGYGGYALAVEPSKLAFCKLGDSDTKLFVDRQGNGEDLWKDEYLSEVSLEFNNPELHGVLTGVTG